MTTSRRIALGFGTVFVILGWLGYVSAMTPGGILLGEYAASGVHAMVHIATGVVAIVAALADDKASKVFFQTFAILYALVAVLGVYYGHQPLTATMPGSRPEAVIQPA